MRLSALLCRAAGRLWSVMEKLPLTLMGILGSNQSSLWLCRQTRLLFWSVVDAAKFKAVRGENVLYRYDPGPVLCVRLLLLGVTSDPLQQQWKDCFLPCSPTQLYKGFEAGGSALACLFYHLLMNWAEKCILLSQTQAFFSSSFFFLTPKTANQYLMRESVCVYFCSML